MGGELSMLNGAVENESSTLETVKEQELKKLSTSAGEKLKNVTSAEGNQKKKIKLITRDRVMFEVDPFFPKEMQTVQSLIEQNGGDDSIIIQICDVTSHCFRRIIEYCMEHCSVAESHNAKEKLKLLDEKFLERMNTRELKEMLLAARSLNMENFEKFMIQSVTNAIKNKSVEFMREFK